MSPTAASKDYLAIESELGADNYKPLDVVLSRGEGVWVWDVDGISIWIAWPPTPRSTRATVIPKSWMPVL